MKSRFKPKRRTSHIMPSGTHLGEKGIQKQDGAREKRAMKVFQVLDKGMRDACNM